MTAYELMCVLSQFPADTPVAIKMDVWNSGDGLSGWDEQQIRELVSVGEAWQKCGKSGIQTVILSSDYGKFSVERGGSFSKPRHVFPTHKERQ